MPEIQPSRARIIVAWIVVVLVVIAVWKFVDWRNQPPMVIQWVTWVR
jgi:hypothetical protein